VPAPQPQVQTVVANPAPAPRAPEGPPPLNVRFEGRITSTTGAHLVYASYGDTGLVLTSGQALPNGYIVKSVGDQAVEFTYPPLGTTARLPLPPAPTQEIR
jgi:hypothetical protein